jgi:hypothetical protein
MFWQGFKGTMSKCKKFGEVFEEPIESLLRRYRPSSVGRATIQEKLYTQWALFRAKIYKLKKSLS